ncbi:MAG TPA: hypothetical protein DHV36_17705 [Desulfobacteraceae bacterium]|nr:hypothetical protein [Desulfobacteraceae bacterium]
MAYTDKKNEAESRRRHRAFWNNSSEGIPLVFAVADKPGFTLRPWMSKRPRKEWDLDPAWHLSMVQNYLDGTCFLADAMPVASLMVGLDITNTAVLAGGDYDYSRTGDFIDFKPGRFALDRPVPPFTPGHSLVRDLKACYGAVINQVGRRAAVNPPMTLDALSTLYGLCGSHTLLTALINRKEDVKQRVKEMTRAYLGFYDYFYAYLAERGYGESSSWFQVFCEGTFESVRCDFSLMLSPDMFREFVIPEITQVCNHMDHTLFNMCSVKHARFIDALAGIDSLDGIFWNPEPYLDGIKDFLPALRRIKERGMLLEIVCQKIEDAVLAVRELGPDGLYLMIEPRFPSPDHARRALEKIYNACP